MIFYHPDYDFRFSDYGIEIPIVDDRAKVVFHYLKNLDASLTYFDPNLIPTLTQYDLKLVHNEDFIERVFGSCSELEHEFLTCFELVDAFGNFHRYNSKNAKKDFTHARNIILKQAGVTYQSTKSSLQNGFSYFLGGGMHHAMSFGGRGFCLINDVVIAIKKLQNEKFIQTAWVIDLDAHKGDGTAELTRDDSTIVTLSAHMKTGWPLDTGPNSAPWFIPSNIDVEIDLGEEGDYLARLKHALDQLDNNYKRPDVVIVVNGADPYEYDELQSTEKIKLSREQLLARDILVYEFLAARKIPQSYVMAGGYGKRSWEIYAQFLKFVWERSPKRSEISSR